IECRFTLLQILSVHVNEAIVTLQDKGGLTTHGAPGNRGSWGPLVLAQTQKSL
ncbi:unnamed protein product, partial [Staurois parvus]